MAAKATQDRMSLRVVRIGTYLAENFISLHMQYINELASENIPRGAAGIIGPYKHTRSALLKILDQYRKGRPGT